MVTITSIAWKAGPTDRIELRIFLALADDADQDGKVIVDVGCLARKSRLSRPCVQRAISALIVRHWVIVRKRPRPCRYWLNLGKLFTAAEDNLLSPEEKSCIDSWCGCEVPDPRPRPAELRSDSRILAITEVR